jgi:hypothetical protein
LERLSVCVVAALSIIIELRRVAAAMENVSLLSDLDAADRPLVVGEGGGSVFDLRASGLISGSSSCSSAVNDCFSLEGEVIGEGPLLLGGVEGLPMTVVGEDGDEGRRKGEGRGELKDRDEGL